MELSELRMDKQMLLEVLGLPDGGVHLCPFHDERNKSFSIYQDAKREWKFRCHSCGVGGSVIDAVMLKQSIPTPKEALKYIERNLGVKIFRDQAVVEPSLDMDRANHLIEVAQKHLLSSWRIQEEVMSGKRGITNMEEVHRYRLGYVEGGMFKNLATGKSWPATGWILPITAANGRLLGVKIHCEKRHWDTQPKCMWAPFGTHPTSKPVHGIRTLWPAPERWYQPDRLFLCGGELKALALISAGFAATSPTTGESGSGMPPRMLERIVNVFPGQVFVVYDNDAAGIKWRDIMTRQMEASGLSVASFHCGQLKASLASPFPRDEIAPEPQEGGEYSRMESPRRTCEKCGCNRFWRLTSRRDWSCVMCFPPTPIEAKR